MAIFLKRLFRILILPISLVLTLFILNGIYIQKDAIYSSKRRLYEENKNDVRCLIIGSSHSYSGIVPSLLPFKTINIGEPAKPIEVDIEFIEKYIDKMPNLKYIIIPIDYFTFYYSGLTEPYTIKYYHHWNLHNGFIKSYSLKKYHIFTCGLSFVELFESFIKLRMNDTLFGFTPQFGDFSKQTDTYKKEYSKKRINRWNEFWIDTSNSIKIFNRIKDLTLFLKQKNIIPIFVTMPVTRVFYEFYDKNIFSKNSILLKKLISTTEINYINLQAYPIFKNDSLFFDGDHLNNKGAIIGTNIIRSLIVDTTALVKNRY